MQNNFYYLVFVYIHFFISKWHQYTFYLKDCKYLKSTRKYWFLTLIFVRKKMICGRIFIISFFTTKTWIFGINYWYRVPIYRIIRWQAGAYNNVLLLEVVACLHLHFSVLKMNLLKKSYNVYQIPKEIQFIQKIFKKKISL